MMHVRPDQDEEDQLAQGMTCPLSHAGKALRRGNAVREERYHDQRQGQKQQDTTDSVQDGRLGCRGKPVRQYLGKTEIAELRPRSGSWFGHGSLKNDKQLLLNTTAFSLICTVLIKWRHTTLIN